MSEFSTERVISPQNEKKDTKSSVWLRSKQVREMLRISDSTLQNMRITGAIPAYKLGSSWFYREDEIIAALNAGCTKKKE
ncbi:helix-turn-helix domain-containing protein [Maribellus mangrovi]|uniref:helix-turn-helix domain-containing protein n=1 Tax=Maribellus mangrovi TaxID=3133146 RepID=UPI0030ECD336